MELPPRTRRIHDTEAGKSHNRGTTSAYAENIIFLSKNIPPQWNYLRVRGEYLTASTMLLIGVELPPRTRRILITSWSGRQRIRTTSAYAENTPWCSRTN